MDEPLVPEERACQQVESANSVAERSFLEKARWI